MHFSSIESIKFLVKAALLINLVQSNLAFSANSTPSKKETVTFILQKIEEVPSLREGLNNPNEKIFFSFSNDGCELNTHAPVASDVRYSIPIGKIVPNFSKSALSDIYYVELNCEGGTDCISANQLNPDKSKYYFRTHTFGFHSSNRIIMEKFESAFRHLKTLCSGKKDLF